MESRSTITTEINATYPDNNEKFITAEKVRVFMDIINASKFNLVDDDLLGIAVTIGGNTTTLADYINEIVASIKAHTGLEKGVYMVGTWNFSGNSFELFDALPTISTEAGGFFGNFTLESTNITTFTDGTQIERIYTHLDIDHPHVHLAGEALVFEEFTTLPPTGHPYGLVGEFLSDNKYRVTLRVPTISGSDYGASMFATSKSPF